MRLPYTNTRGSGFEIAQRFSKPEADGKQTPMVLRRAWFAVLADAVAFMHAHAAEADVLRIVDAASGESLPSGVPGAANEQPLTDWLGFDPRKESSTEPRWSVAAVVFLMCGATAVLLAKSVATLLLTFGSITY